MNVPLDKLDQLTEDNFLKGGQMPLLLGTLIAKVDNLDRKVDEKFLHLDKKMEEHREKYHRLSNDLNTIQAKFMIDESRRIDNKERNIKFRWYIGISSTLLGIVLGDFLTRLLFHAGS